MKNDLICSSCGRFLVGVESDYTKEWICSDCYDGMDYRSPLQCEQGHIVQFLYPQNGSDWDQEAAKVCLIEGNKYLVDNITIGSSTSTVTLKQFPNVEFNTVLFEKVIAGNVN